MNDPGLDGPMEDVAKDLEQDPYTQTQQKEEEAEQDFLDPR